MLDITEIIERIDAYLSGYILKKMPDGSIRKERISDPIVNDEGKQAILRLISQRMDQVLHSTSILDLQTIGDEVFYFNLNLIQMLSENAKKWELKEGHFNELVDSIVFAVIAIYRKALNGALLNKIFGTPIIQEKKFNWLPWK